MYSDFEELFKDKVSEFKYISLPTNDIIIYRENERTIAVSKEYSKCIMRIDEYDPTEKDIVGSNIKIFENKNELAGFKIDISELAIEEDLPKVFDINGTEKAESFRLSKSADIDMVISTKMGDKRVERKRYIDYLCDTPNNTMEEYIRIYKPAPKYRGVMVKYCDSNKCRLYKDANSTGNIEIYNIKTDTIYTSYLYNPIAISEYSIEGSENIVCKYHINKYGVVDKVSGQPFFVNKIGNDIESLYTIRSIYHVPYIVGLNGIYVADKENCFIIIEDADIDLSKTRMGNYTRRCYYGSIENYNKYFTAQ